MRITGLTKNQLSVNIFPLLLYSPLNGFSQHIVSIVVMCWLLSKLHKPTLVSLVAEL